MKKKNIIFLILITLLGLFLRLYKLGQIPVILNRDEAALAYNAYMLTEVGKDEWGRSWPLTLESFGDYKLPGYPILLIILFKVFGASDFIVRLPSALAGTILIILSYFFAKIFKPNQNYSLLFSLLVALSPIFFFYSHAAWEANVGLCYLIAILILIFNRKKWWHDILLLLITLLAVFTYNTPFLLLPFIIAVIPLRAGIKNYRQWLIPTLGLLIIFLIAGFIQFRISHQKSGITIFSDETIAMAYPAYREKFPKILTSLLGNKYIYWLNIMSKNFIESFSYKFIAKEGGEHPWHAQPGFAHLYPLSYFAAILSLIHMVITFFRDWKKNLSNLSQHNNFYFIYFLIISLAPSIVTVDAPHATRSLLFLYFFLFISIRGIKLVIQQLNIKLKIPATYTFLILIIGALIGSSRYFYNYFTHYPSNQETLKPGFDQKIQELENKYPSQKIAIVDSTGFQYILLSWYLKISPHQYLSTNVRQQTDKIGFKYGEQVTHYHFIAHHDDRKEDEKIVLEWENKQWIIKNY